MRQIATAAMIRTDADVDKIEQAMDAVFVTMDRHQLNVSEIASVVTTIAMRTYKVLLDLSPEGQARELNRQSLENGVMELWNVVKPDAMKAN